MRRTSRSLLSAASLLLPLGGAAAQELPLELFTPLEPVAEQPATAPVSHRTLPLERVVKQAAGDRGMAPAKWFWERIAFYHEELDDIRAKAERVRARGEVPMYGLQLWQDIYTKSQPGGMYHDRPGHADWVRWLGERPQYQSLMADGGLNPWGYVAPWTPLDAGDVPEHHGGARPTWADWHADRLGRLSGHMDVNAIAFSDFFDSFPHATVFDHGFTPAVIAAFEEDTGLSVAGASIAEQAASLRRDHADAWLDWCIDGWTYGWAALAREVERRTGREAWLVDQSSFSPAVYRLRAIDARRVVERVGADKVLFKIQTLNPFMIRHLPMPPSYETVRLGLWGAREPSALYANMLASPQQRFFDTVEEQWPDLTPEARRELWAKRFRRSWLWNGWAHVATRDGRVRRIAAMLARNFHDRGETPPQVLELLRAVEPVRPAGPAIYYSIGLERAHERRVIREGLGDEQLYLKWFHEELTDPIERGLAVNCYASDVALDALAPPFAPTAWIVADREVDGRDALGADERRRLEAIAPILDPAEAAARAPIRFESDRDGRELAGFGFGDQQGRLIVVVSDVIRFGESDADLPGVTATVHLDLPAGAYRVEDLLGDWRRDLVVEGDPVALELPLERWDTRVLAVSRSGDPGR